MTDLNYNDPSYLDLEREVRELRGAVEYLRPRYDALLAAAKAALFELTRCEICHGTGVRATQACFNCHGKGAVDEVHNPTVDALRAAIDETAPCSAPA